MTVAGKVIRKPRFDATISLGSVLTFIAGSMVVPFLVFLVQDGARQDNRLTALETTVRSVAGRVEEAEKRADAVRDDVRAGLRHLDGKLTTITLALTGFRPPPPPQ